MSLFNRPAWAKTSTTEQEGDGPEVNIFSHSRSFPDIIAEQQRRKQEKAERKKIKEERRSSGKHKREGDKDDGLLKKRRITLEDGEKLLSSVGLPNVISRAGDEDDHLDADIAGPVRRSGRTNKEHVDGHVELPFKPRNDVVEIDDGSEGEDTVVQHVTTINQDESDESDDEFADLRRRARLQQEQKSTGRRPEGSNTTLRTASTDSASKQRGYGPMPEDEPIIELFIESRIPDTTALLVKRKLSQRLAEVRDAWCSKQGFPPEFRHRVFFVHRMRRVYSETTCKSLGFEIDAFGELTMKGAEGKEGVERVHLEAVTAEIFEEMKVERALEAKRRSAELAANEHADAGAEEEERSKNESAIRVKLVAKNITIFKLKVKPNTRFSKIADAYSVARLDGKQAVRLDFDGEPLDPGDEVQNTEISDDDIIHVYPI